MSLRLVCVEKKEQGLAAADADRSTCGDSTYGWVLTRTNRSVVAAAGLSILMIDVKMWTTAY